MLAFGNANQQGRRLVITRAWLDSLQVTVGGVFIPTQDSDWEVAFPSSGFGRHGANVIRGLKGIFHS
jgi:hypothetical protein